MGIDLTGLTPYGDHWSEAQLIPLSLPNKRTTVPPALSGAFFIPGRDASSHAKADRDKKWRA